MFPDFFAIGIAAVLGFAVGAAWYSPQLFGVKWQNIMGVSWNDGHGRFSQAKAMGFEFVSLLVMAFVLAELTLATGVHGPLGALRLGFWAWLGFQATTLFFSVLFERRPLELFYIDAGERLASTLAMSLVVGLWQ